MKDMGSCGVGDHYSRGRFLSVQPETRGTRRKMERDAAAAAAAAAADEAKKKEVEEEAKKKEVEEELFAGMKIRE